MIKRERDVVPDLGPRGPFPFIDSFTVPLPSPPLAARLECSFHVTGNIEFVEDTRGRGIARPDGPTSGIFYDVVVSLSRSGRSGISKLFLLVIIILRKDEHKDGVLMAIRLEHTS